MERFSSEVCKEIKSYVYRLIDPRNGQTFYVGKGKNNRVFDHVKGTIDFYNDDEETSDDDPNKIRIIREILDSHLDVIYIIQRWNLTDKEALEVESALIDAYQGLSNIQAGYHSEYGVTNAELLENRFKKPVYNEPEDFKYIIKVRQWRLDELMPLYPNSYRYEATRSAWRTRPRDIDEYPYVFSVTDGIVQEVYRIREWHYLENRDRYEFVGEIANDIRLRFVDHKIPKEYMKKGMASPLLFSKNNI